MKAVIFGASGRTGLLLTEEALASGYQIIAYVRSRESVRLVHPDLEVVVGQLNEKEKLKTVISGSDACISTLGGSSLTKHSYEIIEGINNIVNIMEEEKVKRFIYLSSLGVGDSRYYMPQPIRFIVADLMLRIPLKDHNTNENHITKSQLEWTIVRPGSLSNNPKTINLKHGSENIKLKGNSKIPRANVAEFMLNQLTDNHYLNKCVWLNA